MGDAHGHKYLDSVKDLSRELSDVDLILLAGDIAEANQESEFEYVMGEIRKGSKAPIVGVFGNDEWEQSREEYRKKFPITFLDDEATTVSVDGTRIKIVGSTGSLDRPTWWQRTNVPNIWRKYKERVNKITGLLHRGDAEMLILLMHYAPTYLTLEGERERAFPEMGCKLFEPVLLKTKPDLVIHAHAHDGKRKAILREPQRSLDDFKAQVQEVPIYNVSLPLVGGVTKFLVMRDEDGLHIKVQ